MAAYRRVYDSRHLQADCQEPGSALEPYGWQSSMGYLYRYLLYGATTTRKAVWRGCGVVTMVVGHRDMTMCKGNPENFVGVGIEKQRILYDSDSGL